ncbi:hypothetical protein C2E23DRAFT_357453 [Lenzites betulinus]|nr:hypothetical protein C2E23DRAFT_357453 [Lenzites betulinus]
MTCMLRSFPHKSWRTARAPTPTGPMFCDRVSAGIFGGEKDGTCTPQIFPPPARGHVQHGSSRFLPPGRRCRTP